MDIASEFKEFVIATVWFYEFSNLNMNNNRKVAIIITLAQHTIEKMNIDEIKYWLLLFTYYKIPLSIMDI